MITEQIKFWEGDFGKAYTDRNTLDTSAWEQLYINYYGKSKLTLNEEFIGDLSRDISILEVGSNTGLQLRGFQSQGFKNLFGIELQWYAVQKSKELLTEVNIIQGSAFDIPFKDNYFDLVCTHGVLIHIAPKDLNKVFSEMYRCSKRYILGFEYFDTQLTSIDYRGHEGFLWKADYCALFQAQFPDLKVIKKEILPYISENEKGKSDCMYLLEKTNN